VLLRAAVAGCTSSSAAAKCVIRSRYVYSQGHYATAAYSFTMLVKQQQIRSHNFLAATLLNGCHHMPQTVEAAL
jgi:transketolase N-terminal domain/subunit